MSARSLLLSAWFLVAAPAARGDDFSEPRVRPVLVERCFKCHGEKQQKGGIRLDGPTHFKAAPDGAGPLVVPGKPDDSRLIKAVRQTGDVKMPPNGKLPAAAVRALEEWVKAGAKWPTTESRRAAGGADDCGFKPVQVPQMPAVKDGPAAPIDSFVLAKLEAKGLKPSPAADRRTLIRRVYFDLTGLPPTADELEAFVKDDSGD